MTVGDRLRAISASLARECGRLAFSAPVTHVYNPLLYAAEPFSDYLERYARQGGTLFLGMNPGPFGMAQTGIPFGEVGMVRDWLRIDGKVGKPDDECARRPVLGFDCPRAEVSGRRLWQLFQERFETPEAFFAGHLVLNYCPLLFLSDNGRSCRNLTPDRLRPGERAALAGVCDRHLELALGAIAPAVAVGIGRFATACLGRVVPPGSGIRVESIPHPSPANPAANRDYGSLALRALREAKVWD